MSYVTNVILTFAIGEDKIEDDKYVLMDKINEWLNEKCLDGFREPLDWDNCPLGGGKNLETPIYVGAFNYFPDKDFYEFLKTLPWDQPENMQLFIQKQTEDKFTEAGVI